MLISSDSHPKIWIRRDRTGVYLGHRRPSLDYLHRLLARRYAPGAEDCLGGEYDWLCRSLRGGMIVLGDAEGISWTLYLILARIVGFWPGRLLRTT
jgi:hypothetical protein